MPIVEVSEPSKRSTLLYRIIYETPAAAAWASSRTPMASKHIFLVMTEPKAGQDEGYNRFYEQAHIPEVLATPDMVGCRRLKLDPAFENTPRPQSYAATYEMTTDDPLASIGEVFRRAKSGEYRENDDMDRTKDAVGLYDVIAESHI